MRREPGVAETQAAVRDVRAHLRRTNPSIDHQAIGRILASHGLRHYPDALMLEEPDGAIPRRQLIPRRRKRAGQKRQKAEPLPYFSEAFYRLAHDDLRDLEIPMVLHWQIHGRIEGRSPHPFIDIDWLSEQMPDVLPCDVVDLYLTDKTRWLVSPSPYIETESFMLTGPWDGVTHPWLQIMRHHAVDPWMRGVLGVIDLADADDELRMAAIVLTAENPGPSKISGFSVFSEGGRNDGHGTFTVVPGFFMGRDAATLVSCGNDVLSADATAIRLRDRFVAMDVRNKAQCTTLVFVTSAVAASKLEALATAHGEDSLFAPIDAAQQETLQQLGARTLTPGRQINVEAAAVEILGSET